MCIRDRARHRSARIALGSVPPIYTKGVTAYYIDVLQWFQRERSCARRKALGRWGHRAVREGLGCSPPRLATARHRSARIGWGSVPHIYTKSATLYYNGVLEWAARYQASARRKALGRWGHRTVREGWGDRLQGSLWPDSAAAWVGVWLGQKVRRGENEVPDLTGNTATPPQDSVSWT